MKKINTNLSVLLVCVMANTNASADTRKTSVSASTCNSIGDMNQSTCEGKLQQIAGASGAELLIDSEHDAIQDRIDLAPRNHLGATDFDEDGVADHVDTDDDNDGQLDRLELMCGSNPLDKTSISSDYDGDNLPDCYDLDDDNDGVAETC